MKKFKKGDRVTYTPSREGQRKETGVVSSIGSNDSAVFVKYDNVHCKMFTGDEPFTSALTPLSNLSMGG